MQKENLRRSRKLKTNAERRPRSNAEIFDLGYLFVKSAVSNLLEI